MLSFFLSVSFSSAELVANRILKLRVTDKPVKKETEMSEMIECAQPAAGGEPDQRVILQRQSFCVPRKDDDVFCSAIRSRFGSGIAPFVSFYGFYVHDKVAAGTIVNEIPRYCPNAINIALFLGFRATGSAMRVLGAVLRVFVPTVKTVHVYGMGDPRTIIARPGSPGVPAVTVFGPCAAGDGVHDFVPPPGPFHVCPTGCCAPRVDSACPDTIHIDPGCPAI